MIEKEVASVAAAVADVADGATVLISGFGERESGPMNVTKWSRAEMAARVARDIPDGAVVNLGIGLPTLVANHLPEGREIVLHSEDGVIGMGPAPAAGHEDYDLSNAGKQPVTLRAGGTFFHHADSFAMRRGGHLDVCVLGAFQVSAGGDLAVIDVTPSGLVVRDSVEGLDHHQLQQLNCAPLQRAV